MVGPEQIERHGHAGDVGDAVEGSHFVKMDLIDRHSVGRRFGLGESAEDAQRQLARPVAESAAGQDFFDVRQVSIHRLFGRVDAHLRGGEPALADLFDLELDRQSEGFQRGAHRSGVDARVEQGGQRHVAADAAETVEMEGAHGPSLSP